MGIGTAQTGWDTLCEMGVEEILSRWQINYYAVPGRTAVHETAVIDRTEMASQVVTHKSLGERIATPL